MCWSFYKPWHENSVNYVLSMLELLMSAQFIIFNIFEHDIGVISYPYQHFNHWAAFRITSSNQCEFSIEQINLFFVFVPKSFGVSCDLETWHYNQDLGFHG